MGGGRLVMVPLDRLRETANVRRAPIDVAELAESIKRVGLLQPIVGCMTEDGEGVDILMGHRRTAAARVAGLDAVPCLLRPRPAERDRMLMQLAENLERAEMTPMEEAVAFARLVDAGMSQRAIGRGVNRSDMHVSTRLQLLGLPDLLQDALHRRWITPSVALSMPRVLFDDAAAMKRLGKVLGDGDVALRKWAYEEAHRRSRNGQTIQASYQLNRPVSLPVAYVELAQRAAKKAGLPTREWIRDVIEAAAKRRGVTLPAGAPAIETKTRMARRTT